MKLDHVALGVSDLDAALQFYTQKLGLKFKFRELDEKQHEAFAFLELDGGNLELLQGLSADNQPLPYDRPEIKPPYCPHIALGTDDLSSVIERAEAQGIPVVGGPFEIAGQVKWLYLSDPDNHVIEFVQWLK